jgi:beta-glucosidase-like glycosyl hydrolase
MVPWAAVPMAVVNSAAHRALAARGAREGIVLLANARGLLPLAGGSALAANLEAAHDELRALTGISIGLTAQVAALDTTDIQTLTSSQFAALSTAQLRAMETADVAAIGTTIYYHPAIGVQLASNGCCFIDL